MSKKFVKLKSPSGTHPLIWCVAVACAVTTVAVIMTGMVVFIGYLVIRPKVPFVSVAYAELDTFKFDRSGMLTTKLTVVIKAENDNIKAHARFSDFRYTLKFDGIEVALLQAMPFEVTKNSTAILNYVVEATPVPLNAEQMRFAEVSVKRNQVRFDLDGRAQAQWRVGLLGSVGFWCHINCPLQFRKEGDSLISHCTSTSS
ncbi:hypothetical protein V2J09_004826 [Rumex salicifolius]